MKKIGAKFFIGLLVGVLLGAGLCFLIYFLTVGDVAWKEYLENEIIPNAVVVLTAIGTIMIAAMPVISRISAAVNKFDKATKDVNSTVTNNGKNEQKIASLEERLGKIEAAVQNTEEIVRIGFCNNDELVKKGYAKEIAKVGQDNEEEVEN